MVESLKCLRPLCPGTLEQRGTYALKCRKCGALYTEGVIKELTALKSGADRGIIKA